MIRPTLSIVALALAIGALGACSRAPQPAAPPPQVAAAPAPTPTPPPPAKKATMICRNSQDGRNVACGTPNAVMVGIKTE